MTYSYYFAGRCHALAGLHVPCSSERCQADTAKRHAGAPTRLGLRPQPTAKTWSAGHAARAEDATGTWKRGKPAPSRPAEPTKEDGRTDVLPHSPPAPQPQTIQPAPIAAPRGFYAEGKATRSDRAFPCSPRPPPRSERDHRLRRQAPENPRRAPSPTRLHKPLRRPHPLLGAD